MSAKPQFVTKTIAAENTFSDVMQLHKGDMAALSISGINGDTVTVQRKFNQAGDWRDVSNYTANGEFGFVAECNMEIRAGVKTGGYGSGTIIIDIRHD